MSRADMLLAHSPHCGYPDGADDCPRCNAELRAEAAKAATKHGIVCTAPPCNRGSACRVECQAAKAADPQPERPARRLRMVEVADAEPQPVAFGKFVGLRHLPEGTKEFFGYLYGDAPTDKCDLYLHPDQRIAELEGLLAETISTTSRGNDATLEARIRAALEKP